MDEHHGNSVTIRSMNASRANKILLDLKLTEGTSDYCVKLEV